MSRRRVPCRQRNLRKPRRLGQSRQMPSGNRVAGTSAAIAPRNLRRPDPKPRRRNRSHWYHRLPRIRIDTAYFLNQGRDDIISPAKSAVAYFRRVKAPQKTLVLIPEAGHFAFMAAPDAFLAVMTGKVRPFAIARGA